MKVWWAYENREIKYIRLAGFVNLGFPLEVIAELGVEDKVGINQKVKSVKVFSTEGDTEIMKEPIITSGKLQEVPLAGGSCQLESHVSDIDDTGEAEKEGRSQLMRIL